MLGSIILTGLSFNDIINSLESCGYEGMGNEVLYNGFTGDQLKTSIFIGPTYYQRLKHMVDDKIHSRATGPCVLLTRQPAEGRSRDGGFPVFRATVSITLGTVPSPHALGVWGHLLNQERTWWGAFL